MGFFWRKKKPELIYRFIIEDGEVVGLVALPKPQGYGAHWVVSPGGKETSYHSYEWKNTTELDYDLHLSFESIPIYKVKYRSFQRWLSSHIDNFFVIGFFALIGLFMDSFIPICIELVSDYRIVDSIYYQIGFWGLSACVIFLAILLLITNYIEKRLIVLLYGQE